MYNKHEGDFFLFFWINPFLVLSRLHAQCGDQYGAWTHNLSWCDQELRDWPWGTWVSQSVELPTLSQVMILRFTSLSPTLGSGLTAQSLEPAPDSLSPSLSAPTPLGFLSQKLIIKKKFFLTASLNIWTTEMISNWFVLSCIFNWLPQIILWTPQLPWFKAVKGYCLPHYSRYTHICIRMCITFP